MNALTVTEGMVTTTKHTAWLAVAKMVTTGFLLALVAGAIIKLKVFGGGQFQRLTSVFLGLAFSGIRDKHPIDYLPSCELLLGLFLHEPDDGFYEIQCHFDSLICRPKVGGCVPQGVGKELIDFLVRERHLFLCL